FPQYLSALNNILKDYNRSILNTGISATEIQWKQAQQSWFLSKWLQTRKIKKQLSVFRNTPFNNNSEVEQLFADNNQLQEVQRILQQSRFADMQKALKNLFKDEQSDVADIDKKAALIQDLNNQRQEIKRLLQQNRFADVQKALKNLFKDEQTDVADINKK